MPLQLEPGYALSILTRRSALLFHRVRFQEYLRGDTSSYHTFGFLETWIRRGMKESAKEHEVILFYLLLVAQNYDILWMSRASLIKPGKKN